MLKDITAGDFDYLRAYAKDMLNCHENEFVKNIDPNLMRAMYRGKTKYESYENKVYTGSDSDDAHLTALVTIFQSENTVIPALYPKNPTPIIKPGRGSDAKSSALLTAIIKHYMKLNEAKRQNQEAILNARFFGLGWKKLGWRAIYPTTSEQPEDVRQDQGQGFLKGIQTGIQGFLGGGPEQRPHTLESRERPEIPEFETMFNNSENPMNIALDHKADMLNAKYILHSLPRTFHDLEVSGYYDDEEGQEVLTEMSESLKSKFGSRFDSRKTELHLRELHCQQNNGVWILTWVDEFDKPMKYRKSDFGGKGFLFVPLSLTYEPGVRYPVSHLKVASQVQIKTDDLMSKFVELVARSVNLTVVNEQAFAGGGGATLEQNLIRGILKHKGPITPGTIQSFSSGSVSGDLPALINQLQKKTFEILGLDEQAATGQSQNETLGQDELASGGTDLREIGMKDRIKDFMVTQLEKESVLIKQNSNSELHVFITGKDYSDPITGQSVEDQWHSFMTEENPLGAKHYLQGEFEHEFNMDDVKKPTKANKRKALIDWLTLDSQPGVQEANLQGGFRLRRDKVYEAIAETFDNVINPEVYLERLDSRQVAAIQTSNLLLQSGGQLPQTKDREGREAKQISQESAQESKAEEGQANRQAKQQEVAQQGVSSGEV